jgi:hypothetical protein
VADAAIIDLAGDEYRTSSVLSGTTSWRDRVDSIFGDEDLEEELSGEEDLFGLLN